MDDHLKFFFSLFMQFSPSGKDASSRSWQKVASLAWWKRWDDVLSRHKERCCWKKAKTVWQASAHASLRNALKWKKSPRRKTLYHVFRRELFSIWVHFQVMHAPRLAKTVGVSCSYDEAMLDWHECPNRHFRWTSRSQRHWDPSTTRRKNPSQLFQLSMKSAFLSQKGACMIR